MAKKAEERIYFKSRDLVEQYRIKHPDSVLTRFIKTEADVDRTEWLGYSVTEAETQSETTQANQTNVPEVA